MSMDGSAYDSRNLSAIYNPVAKNVFSRFESDYANLLKLNVYLSKKLTERQIERLAKRVVKAVSQSTGTVLFHG